MTSMSSHLVFLDSSDTQSIVVLVDGSRCSISGCGDVNLTSLSLSFGLYVPKFPFSLFIVSKLTKALNCSVAFYP